MALNVESLKSFKQLTLLCVTSFLLNLFSAATDVVVATNADKACVLQ